jgi:ABC-type dipeptide/oligopeptide/nickel transport system permease component
MGTYIVRRVLLMVPTFILISLLVFIIINLAPGRAGQMQLSGGQGESVRETAGAREGYLLFKLQYGLNRPLLFNTRFSLDLEEVQSAVETVAANLSLTTPGEDEAILVATTTGRVLEQLAVLDYSDLTERLQNTDLTDDERDDLEERHVTLSRLAVVERYDLTEQLQNPDLTDDQRTELERRRADVPDERLEIRPRRPNPGDVVDAYEDLEDWGLYAVVHMFTVAREHRSPKVRWQAIEFLTLNAQDRTVNPESGAIIGRYPERSVERVFTNTLAQQSRFAMAMAPIPDWLANEITEALTPRVNQAFRSGFPRYDVYNWSYPLNAPQEEIDAILGLWEKWFARNDPRMTYEFWDRVGIFFSDTRLFNYWAQLLQGNFGVSSHYRRPVTEVIFERWQYSIYLSLLAIFFAYFLSVPIGLYSAVRQGGLFDQGIGLVLFLMYSLPSFFVATLLQNYLTAANEPERVDLILEWIGRFIFVVVLPAFGAAAFRQRQKDRASGNSDEALTPRRWTFLGFAILGVGFSQALFEIGPWLVAYLMIMVWPTWSVCRTWSRDVAAASDAGSTTPPSFPYTRLTGLSTAGIGVTVLFYLLSQFFPAPVSGFSSTEYLFPDGSSGSLATSTTMWQYFKDVVMHLVFPVACLTYGSLAVLSRYARTGLLDVIRSDYIRTARAKGLSEPVVIIKHAVRNGMIPILTLLGTTLPVLIGGSVIIEYIFNIPGMGQLVLFSIYHKDFNVIMGVLQLSAVLTLVGVLLSDISYAIIDPRISFD